MCAFVSVCACAEPVTQTTCWCPLQGRDVSKAALSPGFKRPPIIAPTYSQRCMSLIVDHTIHQLWWAQRQSNTLTAVPQEMSCLMFWLKPSPPPQSSKPIWCRRCGVRPLTPQSCHTRPLPPCCVIFPHLPKNSSSCCKFGFLQQAS